jgi:thiamine biosynthesis lipoprotein
MGSEIHVVLVGAGTEVAGHAPARFEDLEARWSRFRPDSEVSRVNRGGGSFVSVSSETAQLFARALEGWRLTAGLFDPTVLGAVVRAGYDRPMNELRYEPITRSSESSLITGSGGVEVEADRIRLPASVGFDPGGIGKGLAADLVCAELISLGAEGALVNAGGDVRVMGTGPEGAGWTIAVVHPFRAKPVALLGIGEGAVATSTTLLRRWAVGPVIRHHLIDPARGEPSNRPVDLSSVVASDAWLAEIWAKALLLAGEAPQTVLAGAGVSGLVVENTGRVKTSDNLHAYLGQKSMISSIWSHLD